MSGIAAITFRVHIHGLLIINYSTSLNKMLHFLKEFFIIVEIQFFQVFTKDFLIFSLHLRRFLFEKLDYKYLMCIFSVNQMQYLHGNEALHLFFFAKLSWIIKKQTSPSINLQLSVFNVNNLLGNFSVS
ncbi:hypothetical protein XELAEV_18015333mg [Xenopus laevis]|uniref:Uncharacterized protein n=1 Tax=Xenopus laevis TaxID=8355 RepID=A0A974DKD5_XENLA|nr:hypothetical protein XELAEV_18015333mg [Xenopus laevis]